MPPTKHSYKSTNQNELAMLRREVKRMSSAVSSMTEKVDLLIAAADRTTKATTDLAEALEGTRGNVHEPLIQNDNANVPGFDEVDIIPWPYTTVSLNGQQKRRRVAITKTLIIAVLIKPYRKDENGRELSDTKLKAIYGNIRDLRKVSIATAIRELGYCICKPPVKQCRCGAPEDTLASPDPVRWGQLCSRDRHQMVASFETSVLEKERIPIHKCEKHWAGAHMLEEAWSNWTKKIRISAHDDDEEE